ncbi:hypothetical protein ACOMHN_048421 [Nucella lapillus]
MGAAEEFTPLTHIPGISFTTTTTTTTTTFLLSPLPLSLLLHLLLLLLPCHHYYPCLGQSVPGGKTAKAFRSPHPNHPFQHLAVDRATDKVYLSAVNHLHLLTPDLERKQSVVPGPLPDNRWCSPPPSADPCPDPKDDSDSFSQVLLVDGWNHKLITCWSYPSDTIVAFIAPKGPQHPDLPPPFLYVGCKRTPSHDSQRRFTPNFARRSLTNFSIWRADDVRQAAIFFRKGFYVQFIYGFGSEKFSYMVTTLQGVEMRLQCSYHGVDYNLVQAAYTHEAGEALAERLGVGAKEDVLFAVFSKELYTEQSGQIDKSAICVYPLRKIRRKFTAIRRCNKGLGSAGPVHLQRRPSHRCVIRTWINISDDFCDEGDLNTPIEGSEPILGEALMDLSSLQPSALAVAPMGRRVVIFLGSRNGTLMEISINESGDAFLQEDLAIAPGQPILRDLVFDSTRYHLYVLTAQDVFRIPIRDCSRLLTALECVNAGDPHCRWSSLTHRERAPTPSRSLTGTQIVCETGGSSGGGQAVLTIVLSSTGILVTALIVALVCSLMMSQRSEVADDSLEEQVELTAAQRGDAYGRPGVYQNTADNGEAYQRLPPSVDDLYDDCGEVVV